MPRIPVGREPELAEVAGLLDHGGPGCAALVLEGEPGIGKTTILRAAIASAVEIGYRVLSCRPVQSEVSLPFVSLGDLLEPVLDQGVADLPPEQTAALEAALARVPPTETFGALTVSRATLGLLRVLARSDPLLLAIDDSQWLDASTAAILAFALRRLDDARVRVLLVQRSGHQERPELSPELPIRRLTVGPLSADELARLISESAGLALSRGRLTELHATTRGNPYFALELVRGLRADQALAPDDPLPVPEDIAALLRSRVAGLSPATLETLLLIAASPQPLERGIAERASASTGVAEAITAGIVEEDRARLRFVHPLLASVVYADADPEARRAAHLRLADAGVDADQRAVHLARVTLEPDPAVAGELDETAQRAFRRGAAVAAAELEEEALRLTPPELASEGFERALRHAEYRLAIGDTSRGRLLLEELLARGGAELAGAERARVALRLGQVRYQSDDVAAAQALFHEALAHAGPDPALRAEGEQAIAFTAMLGGDVPTAREHARSALEIAERLKDPRALSLSLARVALNEFLSGQGLDHKRLEQAVDLEQTSLSDTPIEWLPSYAAAWAYLMTDELERSRELYERLAGLADERADERVAASVMFALSELESRAGNWERASRLATGAVTRSRQSELGTVYAWSLHAQALVDAHVGHVQSARAAAAEGLQVAAASKAMAAVAQITATLGFLELSLGEFRAAHQHLAPLAQLVSTAGIAEPGAVRFMPNEIEALIGLGELDGAEVMLDQLEESARRLDRVYARATAARCRGLLSAARGDFEAAREHLREALVQHERLGQPFERGRTLLAQGSIERRARQRGAARVSLTDALELFDSLGAALWSERTAAELSRIPGRSAGSGLTETERRVAELVAEGLPNKEIAARLFVTVRTVEAHLSKVYAKLGVRSRAELAARGAGRDQFQR